MNLNKIYVHCVSGFFKYLISFENHKQIKKKKKYLDVNY